MKLSRAVFIARDLIRNRLENGYPFKDGETSETVALDMIEEGNPFPNVDLEKVKRAVDMALKLEGHDLPAV